MQFIRRHWALLMTAGMIPLLAILALFQFAWIRDMGERERYRLAQGLLATAGQLSAAIQNEIAVLPSVFGMDPGEVSRSLESGDWGDFKERWEVWKAYSLDVSIVSGLYIFRRPKEGNSTASIWKWNGESYVPEQGGDFYGTVSRIIRDRFRDAGFLNPTELPDGGELFLLPLPPDGGKDQLWFIIRMDRQALTERMIPLLAEQYLYGKNDYYFRIVDRYDGSVVYQSAEGIDGSSFQKADLQYPLLRSDFRVAFGRQRDPLDSRDSPAAALNILRTRRDVFIAHSDTDRRINIVLSPTAAMLREAAESARWVLEAVHRSGSLAAAVRSGMIRNSILSSGILLLLGAALMVMAMSVRRNQELAERQGEFIATVTHELKSPVAVIRSAADNLASGIIRDAEKTMRYGAAIREEGNRLTLMIDRLLAYARVGDSVPELTESVDLRSLAEKVLGTYQKELEEAAFRVETSLKADMVVKGDRTALELALGNLIGNAVKHGKSGEFLGVDLREDDGWAVVAVRDHGPGVPRKERRLIFEAFYRGESARKEQRPGSGLGLNLVKRIVSAHGGMVRYAALGDLGSVFSLRLPTAARHG